MDWTILKKIKNRRICLVFITCSLLLLASACVKTVEGGRVPYHFNTYIRILSPAGTDVIDSLKRTGAYEQLWITDARANSDKLSIRFWGNSGEEPWAWGVLKEGTPAVAREGWAKTLNIHWGEIPQDENLKGSYTLSMRSPMLFGDNEEHTAKFYIKNKGYPLLEVEKCEVDGKIVTPEYNYDSSNVDIFLTIQL